MLFLAIARKEIPSIYKRLEKNKRNIGFGFIFEDYGKIGENDIVQWSRETEHNVSLAPI